MQLPSRSFSRDSSNYINRNLGFHASKDFRPRVGNSNRVFGVRAGKPVNGDHRPTISQSLCVVRAHVHHRLDRKNITLFDFRTLAGLSVVGNLRVLMHAPANAMTDIVTHHRVSVLFGVRLHRPTNVAQMFSDSALFNGQVETLFSNSDQLQTILVNAPDGNCSCRISDKIIEGHSNIDGKNVAFLQFVTRRKTVHNLFVHRGANRTWTTIVTLESRIYSPD